MNSKVTTVSTVLHIASKVDKTVALKGFHCKKKKFFNYA